MISRNFTRKGNIRPRLVSVVGHYGAPWFGVRASAERIQRQPDGTTIRVVEVVTARHTSAASPQRIVVPTTWVRPLHIYACPQGVLENLTKCGALALCEYQALLADRLRAIKEAEALERICRPSRARKHIWHNIGRGLASGETREFIR